LSARLQMKHGQRIGVALLISFVLNGILLASVFSIAPSQDKLSTLETVASILLKPAEDLTEWIAPGHGGVQFLVLAISSVFLYAAISWVALSLIPWWQSRG
jgi:hypothetical protein